MRWLAAALLLAAGLAGCIGGPDERLDEAGGAPALVGDVLMQGADVVERTADSVTLRWASSVDGIAVTVPFLGRSGSEALTWLTFPQDQPLALEATIAASADAALDVGLVDSGGLLRCRARNLDDQICRVLLLEPPEDTGGWAALVRASGGTTPSVPFTVEVTVRTVDAASLLRPALPNPSDVLRFDAPVAVDSGTPMHEPSLAVSPDGTVWVAGYVDRAVVWRSRDGGASFERLEVSPLPYCADPRDLLVPLPDLPGLVGSQAPRTSHVGCGDVELAVGDEDTLYFTQHWSGEGVHVTHDGGTTWLSQSLASNEVALTDRQWLVADGDLAWLAFNTGRRAATGDVTGSLVVARTLDGGRTWAQVGQVVGAGCIPGSFARSPADGALYIGGCSDDGPMLAVSTDDGVTWDWRSIAQRSGQPVYGFCFACAIFTWVATDDAGNVYAVWSDPGDDEDLDVLLAVSTDGGATFSEPVRVNTAPGSHLLASVAAAAPGEVVVTWYGTSQRGDPNAAMGAWYAHAAVSRNALDAAPAFEETLVWREPVQYGPLCIVGGSCASGRNLGDLFEAAWGPDGALHVAFVDGTGGGTWTDASRVFHARGEVLPGPARTATP